MIKEEACTTIELGHVWAFVESMPKRNSMIKSSGDPMHGAMQVNARRRAARKSRLGFDVAFLIFVANRR